MRPKIGQLGARLGRMAQRGRKEGSESAPPSHDHRILVDDAHFGEFANGCLVIVDVAVDNHEAQSVSMGEVLDSTVNVLGVEEVVAEAVWARGSA